MLGIQASFFSLFFFVCVCAIFSLSLSLSLSDLSVNRVVGRGASEAVSLIRDSAGYHPIVGCKNTATKDSPANYLPGYSVLSPN